MALVIILSSFLIMIPTRRYFREPLYKGFRIRLIPNRDTQGYQKFNIRYRIVRFYNLYTYGAVPDYDLDEMHCVQDPKIKIRLLFEAYRHGMKIDYDKHQSIWMTDTIRRANHSGYTTRTYSVNSTPEAI
jgi:hypothetical protein